MENNPINYHDPYGLIGPGSVVTNILRPLTGQTANEAAVSGMVVDSIGLGVITASAPNTNISGDLGVALSSNQAIGGAQTVGLSIAITAGIYGAGASITSISAAVALPVTLAAIGGIEVGLGIGSLVENLTGNSIGEWIYSWTHDNNCH